MTLSWTRFALVAGIFLLAGCPPEEPQIVEGVYYVSPGDTLSGIASRLSVRGGVNAIVADNGIGNPDRLSLGQALTIHAPGATIANLPVLWPNPLETERWCSVTSFHPEPEDALGEFACVRGPGDARVCHDVPNESVHIFENGRGFTVPISTYNTAPIPNVEAGEVDLDQDGFPELVVAVWVATSNGLARQHHTAMIFDGKDRTKSLYFSTVGWPYVPDPHGKPTVSGLFPRMMDGQCGVAATAEENLYSPNLGGGQYDVRRVFNYRDGDLWGSELDIRVIRNHRSPVAQRRGSDAFTQCPDSVDTETVTVVSVNREPVGFEDTLVLRDSSGTLASSRPNRIFDECSGMYFPKQYLPARIVPEATMHWARSCSDGQPTQAVLALPCETPAQ